MNRELESKTAAEYCSLMQLLLVFAAMLGIAVAFGLGGLLAMHGYYSPLIIIFLAWFVAFAKFGCLPPEDSH